MILAAATDKFEIVRSSAAAIDTTVAYIDANSSTGVLSGAGREVHAYSSAATGDLLGVPAGSTLRRMKFASVRNKDASLACDVTVQMTITGPASYEIHKVTLNPGDCLEYIEGVGFYVLTSAATRGGLKNFSTADQSIGASATAYLTGSRIALPNPVVTSVLRWRAQVAKTAAATATQTVAVRFGTGGSTSDTARCSFTLDTETAAADEAIYEIIATIRGPIGASCVVEATLMVNDNLSTTGFSNTARKAQMRQATSAAFDITPAGTLAGVSIQTGASHALTVRQVHAEYLTTAG